MLERPIKNSLFHALNSAWRGMYTAIVGNEKSGKTKKREMRERFVDDFFIFSLHLNYATIFFPRLLFKHLFCDVLIVGKQLKGWIFPLSEIEMVSFHFFLLSQLQALYLKNFSHNNAQKLLKSKFRAIKASIHISTFQFTSFH